MSQSSASKKKTPWRVQELGHELLRFNFSKRVNLVMIALTNRKDDLCLCDICRKMIWKNMPYLLLKILQLLKQRY